MADAAGCDVNRDTVPMIVSQYDYMRGDGAASVESALLSVSDELARDGANFPRETLSSAAEAPAAMSSQMSVIEIKLPGAVVYVQQTNEGKYLVTQSVICA